MKKDIPNIETDDEVFKQIDKLARKLLALVEGNNEYALSLHVSKKVDEDNINAYTIQCGFSDQIVDAMFIDLKGQIDEGNFTLFNDFSDMIQGLHIYAEEEGIDTEENIQQYSQLLH